MRSGELVVFGIIAYGTVVPAATGRRPHRGVLGAALGVAVLAQVLVEGVRWPLVTLYVVAVVVAASDALNEERRLRGAARLRQGVWALGLVALAGAGPALLPVPSFPTPAGPFDVGRATVAVVDEDRPPAPGSPSPGGRVIPLRVWYPATAPDGAEPAIWAGGEEVPLAVSRAGAPGWLFSSAGRAPARSYADAPPLSGRFPVVVFVHGENGFAGISVDLVEGIASRGYVVVAADHPPLAVVTRYPGASVTGDALPDDDEARAAAVETVGEDVVAVFDALAAGEAGPLGPLAATVDAERIGVVGHALGGGGAAWACLDDERCDVLVGLDAEVGEVPDRLVARELQVPSLFVRTGDPLPGEGRLRGLAERSPSVSVWVSVPDLAGADLTALRTLGPLAAPFGLRGPLDPETSGDLVGREVGAFLDRHLAGIGGAPLDVPPPPGVERETLP